MDQQRRYTVIDGEFAGIVDVEGKGPRGILWPPGNVRRFTIGFDFVDNLVMEKLRFVSAGTSIRAKMQVLPEGAKSAAMRIISFEVLPI